MYTYAPCGNSVVYIQVVLDACKEGAMGEGYGWRHLRASRAEQLTPQNAAHTHSWHLQQGVLVVSIATAQLICRWETQESMQGDYCTAADLHAENISPAGTGQTFSVECKS